MRQWWHVVYRIRCSNRDSRGYHPEGDGQRRGALEQLGPQIPHRSEYAEVEERQRMLTRLIGIEDRVWARVAGFAPVYAIADEDLDRSTDEKTSAVHFLRFELNDGMKQALKSGAALAAGVDHPNYRVSIDPIAVSTITALSQDLQ